MTLRRADLDAARRLQPARHGVQYSFAHAFAAAEMERALGDATGAREDLRRALEDEAVATIPRYAWQLVWLGLRVEAEASEPAPDRVAALAALARELPATTPQALAYRALAAAESARGAGRDANWTEAIDASRRAEDPYLVAYALLRRPRLRARRGIARARRRRLRRPRALRRRSARHRCSRRCAPSPAAHACGSTWLRPRQSRPRPGSTRWG